MDNNGREQTLPRVSNEIVETVMFSKIIEYALKCHTLEKNHDHYQIAISKKTYDEIIYTTAIDRDNYSLTRFFAETTCTEYLLLDTTEYGTSIVDRHLKGTNIW